MIKLKEFIQRARVFINENPQRKKLLLIIFILAIIPLTVIAALTVQDLRQRAGGPGMQIVDASGNFLSTTSDTQVYLKINLPDNWVSLSMKKNNNLIKSAYAQTSQCSPPYQGFLGCFSSSNHPSGSVCTSSCTTDDGQSGEWCYSSTTVGSVCTSSNDQSGVCNEQGTCVASAVSTPTPTPAPVAQCNYDAKPDGCNDISKFCYIGTCYPCSSGFLNLDQTKGCEASSSNIQPTTVATPPTAPLTTCDGGPNYANTISGTVYEDVNKDGQYDQSPPQTKPFVDRGLAGWNVILKNSSGSIITTTTSNTYGSYEFSSLCNGAYTVSEEIKSGWTITEPTNTFYSITITGGSGRAYVDFGNIQPNSTSVSSPTPATQTLTALRIENKDNDGSSGGSNPIIVTSNFSTYINISIPWKLNELMIGQNQGTRVVQITLFSNTGETITLSASVNLVRLNGPTNSTQFSPHVYILEDDGTLKTPWDTTKKFYEKYPDQYDLMAIFHKKFSRDTYGMTGGGGVQYHIKGNFARAGIPDQTSLYGTTQLLGLYWETFDFNKVYVKRNPNNSAIALINDVYFALFFHELTHYWGVILPDELKDAQPYNWNTKEYDRVHWELLVNSWLGDFANIRTYLTEKEGKYYLKKDCSKEPKHHDFDLYSMGLKSPEEIKDKLVIIKPYNELPYGNPYTPCDTSLELSKDFIRKTYTIQDFINVLGPRIPSVADAQKDFTIAFVMVVPKGETLNQEQIDALNWIADKFPVTWYKSTEGRSTLNGIKSKDLTPPIISNVKTSATKSSIKVTWATNEPASSFVIYTHIFSTNPLIGTDYIYPNVITNPPKFSTSHEINIQSSGFSPILPNTEYPVKIISIDEDYNMASFDAGKIVTTDKSSSTTPSTPVTNTAISSEVYSDLNNDGAVNCKDTKILISQYGQKGTNLSTDLNKDGIVDGIDYNILIRNYTPGDTTVCTQ